MTRLTFRVETRNGRLLRYGTEDNARSPQALADDHATCVRTSHPEGRGDLTVWVWPARDGEHYRDPIPAGARRYDYPRPLTPDEVHARNALLFAAARAAASTLPASGDITIQLPT